MSLPLAKISTAFELEEWVRKAQPGERAVYHHGHLAADRQGETRQARRVDMLASRAHDLGEVDQLILRPCGHLKEVKPASHKIRLLQQRDPEESGSSFYFAELLP